MFSKKYAIVCAAAVALGVGSVAAHAATSYSTGFESPTFATGSINNQDGWTATGTTYEQAVVDTVGYGGSSQSYWRANNVSSGSFGDQPFSAPLPGGVKAGESTSVGATPGVNTYTFSFMFRAGDTVAADGSFISLSASDNAGARINYVGISNTDTGGLTLNAYDTSSNGFGSAADFNETNLTPTPLDRSTWHKVLVETTFVEGASNDIAKYYIDDTLVATLGTWEDYARNDPEAAGNNNQVVAVDRVWFGTRAAPSSFGFTNGDADGFYFDNFAATAVPEPSALGLVGLAGLALLARRSRRGLA